MMYLTLGIIIGLLIAVIVMLSTRRYQTTIERTVEQIGNLTKEKGEIFVETDELKEVENFINSLPTE